MINSTERWTGGNLPPKEKVPGQKDLKDMSDDETDQEMHRLSKEVDDSLEKFKQQLGLDIGHPDDIGHVVINDNEELIAIYSKFHDVPGKHHQDKSLGDFRFKQLAESTRELLNQYLRAEGKWSSYPSEVLKARGEKS